MNLFERFQEWMRLPITNAVIYGIILAISSGYITSYVIQANTNIITTDEAINQIVPFILISVICITNILNTDKK